MPKAIEEAPLEETPLPKVVDPTPMPTVQKLLDESNTEPPVVKAVLKN